MTPALLPVADRHPITRCGSAIRGETICAVTPAAGLSPHFRMPVTAGDHRGPDALKARVSSRDRRERAKCCVSPRLGVLSPGFPERTQP